MATKVFTDNRKIEVLTYPQTYKDSGDLEAATKTISATSEGAVADYTYSPTALTPSTDVRLILAAIALRLQETIDSMNLGCTTLYTRVYVDSQVAGNRVLDINWTSIGAKINGANLRAANLPAMLALLQDGNAHIFYFFHWVDGGNAVISLEQLQWGVGWYGQSGLYGIGVTHYGLVTTSILWGVLATGSTGAASKAVTLLEGIACSTSTEYDVLSGSVTALFNGTHNFAVCSSVATDATFFRTFFVHLQS